MGDAAADDEGLDIQRHGQGGDGDAEGMTGLMEYALGGGVALAGAAGDFGAADGLAGRGGVMAGESGTAGISFEAAARAAVTAVALGVDSHMAGFAGAVAFAVEQRALVDDGGADAGADDDVDHAASVPSSAEVKFTEGGDFGIMVERDRQGQALAQGAAEGRVGDAGQIDQREQVAADVIDRAGRANADRGRADAGGQWVFQRGDFAGDALDDAGQAGIGIGVDAAAREDLVGGADQAEGDLAAAEVDADGCGSCA